MTLADFVTWFDANFLDLLILMGVWQIIAMGGPTAWLLWSHRGLRRPRKCCKCGEARP